MAATLAATVVPGTGLLMIRRKRAGGLVPGVFLLAITALVIIGSPRAEQRSCRTCCPAGCCWS